MPKSQYFNGAIYKTEKAVRRKVEAQLLKLNEGTEYARANEVSFNALLDRYSAEEMPERRATKGGYTSNTLPLRKKLSTSLQMVHVSRSS